MIWFVRACFGFTWLYSLGCWALSDRPTEFLAAGVVFLLVPLAFLPILRELGD